ncbi:gp53-like domain-containing protein [Bacteroides caccae]|jgi:hypothetical protein|uniref:gp53-like domain-containing protein n=1 Tax=Bacteroides caccae TaxID=47678 RepID=UPI0001546F5B|nr:hypothetical protein [Bacteroides caccae]DAI91656.1 MAG TPA: putative tail fiber protein [Bacteriophage sp.]DAK96517.1 MAG TPA: putative tail fiber protein [Caudoviricetes sp.]ASM66434.1 hypothetical protein CGC64_11005 [Bacteroides caccae]EDM22732.1 hypothetical protein BACCAC_01124 [Bacteroides caccae ATCC 43185]MDC7280977.1 hypothetical protein [Bacteroides caccae]
MNDYNSQYSGAKIEELLGQIPNLAKADLSNAMTVNLNQNGYAKFNNGMLIQWGKGGGYTTYHTYYLPMSFLDINYSFSICAEYKNLSESVILSPYVNNKTRTTFVSGITATNISNGVLPSNWNFFWIAIGRWK